ncbi:MAG: DNA sulfur modification protein DndD [Candidatus Methanomethylophilaceae archaeon]|jgi:DNA sulfur modification protein DndD
MIIDELTISNFKNYPGINIFDLSIKTQEYNNDLTELSKNIILIGGLNGSGKTSFSEAIRLCLYGNKMNGTQMSKRAYQNYLDNVHARNGTIPDSFFISLKITINQNNHPIIIRREFKKISESYVENLTLRREYFSLEVISENYWSYFVERLIPPNVSQYFLFDGETVRNTISSDESINYLKSAIRDLTGIKELDDLKRDLYVVRRNIISKSTKKTSQKEISTLEGQIAFIKREISKSENKRINVLSKRNSYLDKFNFNNDEIKRITGNSESDIEGIREKISRMKYEYDMIDSDFVKFCHHKLPFLLSAKQLDITLDSAKKNNDGVISKYTSEKIMAIWPNILQSFEDKIDAEVIGDVLTTLIEKLEQDKSDLDNTSNISFEDMLRLESFVVSDSEIHNFLKAVERREQLHYEISKQETLLRRKSSNDALILASKNEGLSKSIDDANIEIKRLEDIIKNHESIVYDLNRKIRVEERKTIINESEKKSVDTIDDVLGLINERILTIERHTLSNLNNEINMIYPILANKDDMIKEIHITEDYELILMGYDGNVVRVEYISEGEKGILMYSIVYGLVQISNVKMPLIVDSPLGRMDSHHVKNLIKYYFPIVAEQTIILSHDREIDTDSYNFMKGSLNKSYTLTNDVINKVKSGYFGV